MTRYCRRLNWSSSSSLPRLMEIRYGGYDRRSNHQKKQQQAIIGNAISIHMEKEIPIPACSEITDGNGVGRCTDRRAQPADIAGKGYCNCQPLENWEVFGNCGIIGERLQNIIAAVAVLLIHIDNREVMMIIPPMPGWLCPRFLDHPVTMRRASPYLFSKADKTKPPMKSSVISPKKPGRNRPFRLLPCALQ